MDYFRLMGEGILHSIDKCILIHEDRDVKILDTESMFPLDWQCERFFAAQAVEGVQVNSSGSE
jgi:hypothetical protein